MDRYVALLRGVNVGGKNKIAMKSLAALFSDARCRRVETYIQSGNVVFSADATTAAKAVAAICSAIRQQFGFQTQIVLRSRNEMERIEGANPYFKAGMPLDQLHVSFLADAPAAERVALLDPNRSPPDQFTLSGGEIYLYLPNGGGSTKLTNAYFDSKLKTFSTVRNWRTIQKLLEIMRGTIDAI
jgi:uncharacterized protein (DUF1697 family)